MDSSVILEKEPKLEPYISQEEVKQQPDLSSTGGSYQSIINTESKN